MQLIQELTLAQKAGVFIGIPLILLFVLIAARRRRAAAGGLEAAAGQSEPKRGRSKKDSGIPRRKRRKLAAEAAQVMETSAPAAQPAVAESPAPAVEPVAVAETAPASPAPEAVAAPAPPPVPVVPAAVDDPYVQEITFDDEQVAAFAEDTLPEVVVAAPGWPTPGELASSFDPDAFDPLPSAEPAPPAPEPIEDVADEVMIDEEPEQPTGIIEMPAVYADAFAEHDEHEIAKWDGDFDPATGWGEDEIPVAVAVAAESEEWYEGDHAAAGGDSGSSVDQPNPVDLDQFWSDAETEEPWADSSEVEILSDMVEDASVPDWVHDDEPAAWEAPSMDEAPAAPQSTPDGWTIAAPVQGSPVVLDLAGLAAAGHALELVIESSGDGRGVRLRFEAPSTPESPLAGFETAPAVVDPVETYAGEPEGYVADPEPQAEMAHESDFTFESEAEAEVEVELPAAGMEVAADTVAEPVVEDFDVPFLTGGLPTSPDAAVVAPAAEAPVAMPAPDSAEFGIHDLPVEEAQVQEAADRPEQLPEATAAPAMPYVELSEDPATILAEIRARLAALDRRS